VGFDTLVKGDYSGTGFQATPGFDTNDEGFPAVQ